MWCIKFAEKQSWLFVIEEFVLSSSYFAANSLLIFIARISSINISKMTKYYFSASTTSLTTVAPFFSAFLLFSIIITFCSSFFFCLNCFFALSLSLSFRFLLFFSSLVVSPLRLLTRRVTLFASRNDPLGLVSVVARDCVGFRACTVSFSLHPCVLLTSGW